MNSANACREMMPPQTTTRLVTFTVLPILFTAIAVGGCAEVDETELADEGAEIVEPIGEAESPLMAGDGGGTKKCPRYSCPTWAKDLSDCLMVPCEE